MIRLESKIRAISWKVSYFSFIQDTSGPHVALASENYVESLLKMTDSWAYWIRISRGEPRNLFILFFFYSTLDESDVEHWESLPLILEIHWGISAGEGDGDNSYSFKDFKIASVLLHSLSLIQPYRIVIVPHL